RAGGERRHQCRDGAGIDAAREEQAYRYVAHQVAAHRLLEPGTHLMHVLVEGDVLAREALRQPPIAVVAQALAWCPGQGMGRQQLVDAPEEGLPSRHVAVGEEFRQYGPVELGL